MERAVETRVQVAQQDVDSAKRGEIIEVTPTGYHSNVATACCDDRAEEGETAIQPPIRAFGPWVSQHAKRRRPAKLCW